jgi:RNase H-like domain found in reverse transcriptase
MSAFLPDLANHTGILTMLTTKTAEKNFPSWTEEHQQAFDSIKKIVTSQDCLTTINFDTMPENKIYVTTDASNTCSKALLPFRPSWEKAHSVAFDQCMSKEIATQWPMPYHGDLLAPLVLQANRLRKKPTNHTHHLNLMQMISTQKMMESLPLSQH